jgi:hypothetical protein
MNARDGWLHREDRNCLSYWYPKLLAADLPVPRTRIVRVPTISVMDDLYRPLDLDGEDFAGPARTWLAVLDLAAAEIGFPCFLRTGHTSNKHDWERTCYLRRPEGLTSHVLALIEFSEIADMCGSPWNVWAVRELLPTKPVAVVYRGMPLCREFRCFVRDHKLLCLHSYWPERAVMDGFPGEVPVDFASIYRAVTDLTDSEREEVECLASAAGRAVGGEWSVDLLDTRDGWMITDMATANRSWHWPGCPNRITEEDVSR